MTPEEVQKETRRPILVKYAQDMGQTIEAGTTIPAIKELLMALVKTAPKPAVKPAAPVKPMAAAPPKPAAKPNGVPPPRPTAAAAPKPVAAPPKPAVAPKPIGVKPPAAVAPPQQAGVSNEDVAGWMEATSATMENMALRLDRLELTLAGYDPQFNTIDPESGEVIYNIEAADRPQLRMWAFQSNVCDPNLDDASIRKVLLAHRAKGKPFEVVNDLEAMPEDGAAAEATGDGEQIDTDTINAMNWVQLKELADRVGLDYTDISKGPPQPKVLRNRIIEALSAAQPEGTGEEAGEAGELQPGTPIKYTHEGTVYDCMFHSYSEEEGMVNVQWSDNTVNPVPADACSTG